MCGGVMRVMGDEGVIRWVGSVMCVWGGDG